MSYGQYSPNGKTREDCIIESRPFDYVAQRRQTFGSLAQTAHVWAQGDIKYGRSVTAACFFEDGVIYSHGRHFAIAALTDKFYNGRRIVLWHDRTYSISTSSHQSYARDAIKYDDSIVIPVCDLYAGNPERSHVKTSLEALARARAEAHCFNRGYNALTYDDALAAYGSAYAPELKLHLVKNREALRARVAREDAAQAKKDAADNLAAMKRRFSSSKPADYLTGCLDNVAADRSYSAKDSVRSIEHHLTEARRARAAFKTAGLPLYRARASSIVKYWQKKRDAWRTLAKTLENAETHEKDISDVKSYAARPIDDCASYGCILPHVYEKALRLEMPDEAAKILRAYQLNLYLGAVKSTFELLNPEAWSICYDRRTKNRPRDIIAWRNGEGEAYFSHDKSGYLVRRKGDRLQTSGGAEAPWPHAVAIFLRAQQCRTENKDWRPNGEHFRAGHFALDRIDASGGINIGCHRIEFTEMLRLAIKEAPELVKPTYGLPVVTCAN